jgi:hypothetical protein
MSYEKVNQPQHYSGKGLTAMQIIEAFNLNFALGNVIKYALRAGRKPGEEELQDLDKALWYLQRERDAAQERAVARENTRAAQEGLKGLAARESASSWGSVQAVDLSELAKAQVEGKYAALLMSLEESKGSWESATALSDNSIIEFLETYASKRDTLTLEQQETLRSALYDLCFKVN